MKLIMKYATLMSALWIMLWLIFAFLPTEDSDDEAGYGSISRLSMDHNAYLNPTPHTQHMILEDVMCDDCNRRVVRDGNCSTGCTVARDGDSSTECTKLLTPEMSTQLNSDHAGDGRPHLSSSSSQLEYESDAEQFTCSHVWYELDGEQCLCSHV